KGQRSNARGADTPALSQASRATANGATAIGAGAQATFANSTAIGAGASASAPNQIALGSAANTYQAAGVASAASLAAQSGPISFVTTDAAGHLASANLAVPDINGLQTKVA